MQTSHTPTGQQTEVTLTNMYTQTHHHSEQNQTVFWYSELLSVIHLASSYSDMCWLLSLLLSLHAYTLPSFFFVVYLVTWLISRLHSISDRCTDTNMEHWWSKNWQDKTKVFGEKHAPLSLCPPQITHGMPWGWFWSSMVTSHN